MSVGGWFFLKDPATVAKPAQVSVKANLEGVNVEIARF